MGGDVFTHTACTFTTALGTTTLNAIEAASTIRSDGDLPKFVFFVSPENLSLRARVPQPPPSSYMPDFPLLTFAMKERERERERERDRISLLDQNSRKIVVCVCGLYLMMTRTENRIFYSCVTHTGCFKSTLFLLILFPLRGYFGTPSIWRFVKSLSWPKFLALTIQQQRNQV